MCCFNAREQSLFLTRFLALLCSPKAKTAKIVRTVIDSIAKVPNSSQLLVSWWAACGSSWQQRGSGAGRQHVYHKPGEDPLQG